SGTLQAQKLLDFELMRIYCESPKPKKGCNNELAKLTEIRNKPVFRAYDDPDERETDTSISSCAG
ncbi:hypothetical protein, partial [Staphylococcus aureus]